MSCGDYDILILNATILQTTTDSDIFPHSPQGAELFSLQQMTRNAWKATSSCRAPSHGSMSCGRLSPSVTLRKQFVSLENRGQTWQQCGRASSRRLTMNVSTLQLPFP